MEAMPDPLVLVQRPPQVPGAKRSLKARKTNPMQNLYDHLNRQNFRCALVIEKTDVFRISVVQFLRKQGWLVHGIKRAEHAFNLLAHIPYSMIVIDSELLGMDGIDFVHVLRNSREWRQIQVFVITSSQSENLAMQVAKCGGSLIRKAAWEDDLFGFLSTYDGYHVESMSASQEPMQGSALS